MGFIFTARKLHQLKRATVFLFLTIIFGFSAAYLQASGSIRGSILDKRTGKPLKDVTIVVVGTDFGATTGSNGRYIITGAPAGKQILRISLDGFRAFEQEVRVFNTDFIQGSVIDNETGEPLSNIKVKLKGTPFSTTTVSDGTYTFFDMPAGSYTVQIEQPGYKTLEGGITVGFTNVDFELHEDIIGHDTIVATGIATKKAKIGSEVGVSRLQTSQFIEPTYTTTSQLLNAKLPGIQIRQTSGNIGSAYRFFMRSGGGLHGDGQPIIYLDGIRIDDSEVAGFGVGGQGLNLLSDITPEEIDNIEILKGPSASSSFGANGANGVVLISTKRGRYQPFGSNPVRVDYKVVTGWNSRTNSYSREDLISAPDANAIFRTGNSISNRVNVYGGTGIATYFIALNNRWEEGIVAPDRLDRKNIRGNFDFRTNRELTFRVSSSYTRSTIDRPLNDNSLLGHLFNTTAAPQSYGQVGSGRSAIENIEDESVINRFIGTVQADYTPSDLFRGRFIVGLDDHDLRQEQRYPTSETYLDSILDLGVLNIFDRKGRQMTAGLDGQLRIQANPELALTFTSGLQLLDRRIELFATPATGFKTPFVISPESDEQGAANEALVHQREAGIFAEGSLIYKNRLSASLKFRRDYATAIGDDASSTYYPGASIAWQFSGYKWLPDFLSSLKLRSAYGEAGILPNQLDGLRLIYGSEGGGFGNGAAPAVVGNNRIKPERVKEFEVGIDAELFHRYALEATYYRQKATDSIVQFQNSPSTGRTATTAPLNIGSSEGWGFETILFGKILKSDNYNLSFALVNNWQDNEVLSLGGASPVFDRFGINVIEKGLAKHEFYMRPVLGAQFNDDGTYAGPDVAEQRIALGNPLPNRTGSFSVHFNLKKNITLNVLTDWAIDQRVWNGNKPVAQLAGNSPRYNLLATQLGLAGSSLFGGIAQSITPVGGITPFEPGTLEYIAAAEEFAGLDPRHNSNFVEDADFFKVREVSLTYNFSGLVRTLLGQGSMLKNIYFTLSAHNLLTTTKYSGQDPEVNWSGARGLERGQDFFTLQHPRTYNLALRVSL